MTSNHDDPLFRPFRLGNLELKNRIVMAPMTRSRAIDGIPGENVAAYYRRRAENDVGLILSEGAVIERPAARNEPDVPSFYGEAALAGWRHVVTSVHEAAGKMGVQLWHVGGARNPRPLERNGQPWQPPGQIDSPSGLSAPGQPFGEPMSDEAIADTISAYARAAAAARHLGFDLVEIHAAHGYLIDQFFWDGTNTRSDRYGGSTLGERGRFAAEVIAAMRDAAGPDMSIVLRISQWKQQDYAVRLAATPARLAEWLTPLVEAGADAIHCSQRRFWDPEFPEIDGEKGMNLAGWVKKVTGAATIAVGSVGLSGDMISALMKGESSTPASLDELRARLDRGEFDLIAVGRAILADPTWAAKVRANDVGGLEGFSPKALATLA